MADVLARSGSVDYELDGTLAAAAEKAGVHLLRGIEGPDARADLRLRAVCGLRQYLAAGVEECDGFAASGLAGQLFDGAGKDPWMPPTQRFLAALPEDQRFHRFFARGCAAS